MLHCAQTADSSIKTFELFFTRNESNTRYYQYNTVSINDAFPSEYHLDMEDDFFFICIQSNTVRGRIGETKIYDAKKNINEKYGFSRNRVSITKNTHISQMLMCLEPFFRSIKKCISRHLAISRKLFVHS